MGQNRVNVHDVVALDVPPQPTGKPGCVLERLASAAVEEDHRNIADRLRFSEPYR
jgi:hypothetical protein